MIKSNGMPLTINNFIRVRNNTNYDLPYILNVVASTDKAARK